MKSFLYTLLVVAALSGATSCSHDSQDEAKLGNDQIDYSNYFFPTDSLKPYIYVYHDENKPLDDKIYRIYRLKSPKKEHLVIEKFNPNFRITEAFSYDLEDSLKIVDHMIVDGEGSKRKSKVTASRHFPINNVDRALFISDFPAHIDSLIGIYKSSKKVISDGFEYSLFDQTTEAIKVEDEITLSFVNPTTQKGSSNSVKVTRVYAEGYGMTEWYTEDKKIHYRLKRVLSNAWWKENAQEPVVRGIPE